ncbi:hypothetical protein RV07_GL001593 [Enterococcus malodoratus]|nr:hypothetical protein RV07_GL001593 [Enterococcus malodoratus]
MRRVQTNRPFQFLTHCKNLGKSSAKIADFFNLLLDSAKALSG